MQELLLLMTTGVLTVAGASSTAIYINEHRDGLKFEPMPVPVPELFDDPRSPEKYHDSAVLEAVLLDLLTQADSPVELGPKEKPEIHFLMNPLAFEPDIERMRVVLTHPTNEQEVTDDYKWVAVDQATRHLVFRSNARDLFAKFTPQDARIKVEPPRNAKLTNLVGAPYQVFTAYSPGYSETGAEAVVKMHFKWAGNYHTAEAIYFLRRIQGVWIVETRRIFLGM